MENSTTFWKLINESEIKIPIIQRDYAQGRVEEKKRRDDFLDVLYSHLTNVDNTPLHLDFVYGRKDKENNVFFPIDGQQRLTTLFLLHWYIAKNECMDTTMIKQLKNFVYATRISSREFCKALIDENIQIPSSANENEFADLISNKFWFRDAWNNDPTIQAMLVMLQAIHDKFHETNSLWKKLTEDNSISFQILDLGEKEFELTDELYIKMNARGKQLTDFENFKASFIQTLTVNYPEKNKIEHPISKKLVSYCDYFAYRIEKEWCDLFWQYKKMNEKEDTCTIDEAFMNYFNFIAQMFYFLENKNAKAEDFQANDFSIIESVFKNEQALLFLFNSLNLFYKISLESDKINKIKIDTFFENIFQQGSIDDAVYRGQVRLFDDASVNLFQKCLEEGISSRNVRDRIILFCVIQYAINFNLTEANDDLRYYVRVVRNLLQAYRQKSETVFETSVTINNFGSYWKQFEQLLSKANVYDILLETTDKRLSNEKEKAEIIKTSNQDLVIALFKLEEFRHFGGLIHQLKPKENRDKLADYSKAIREIWGCKDDPLIIAALIACDFEGLEIKPCKLGNMWTLGRYNTILTCDDDEISNAVLKLLNTYLSLTTGMPEEKLKQIIAHKINDLTEKKWQYYFLRYYEIMLKPGNYFAWVSKSDFEIETLTKENRSPLLAYHINPYVFAVSDLLNDAICEEKYCWGIYSDVSKIVLKNKVELFCKTEGWQIGLPKDYALDATIKQKYNIGYDLLLKENNNKDRIEIAVDFVKEFLNTLKG